MPLIQERIFWRFTSLKQGIMGKFSLPDFASRDLESGSKGSALVGFRQEEVHWSFFFSSYFILQEFGGSASSLGAACVHDPFDLAMVTWPLQSRQPLKA